jgi:hypothetical protein
VLLRVGLLLAVRQPLGSGVTAAASFQFCCFHAASACPTALSAPSCSSYFVACRFNPRLSKGRDAFIKIMAELGLAPPKMLDIALPANLVDGEGAVPAAAAAPAVAAAAACSVAGAAAAPAAGVGAPRAS